MCLEPIWFLLNFLINFLNFFFSLRKRWVLEYEIFDNDILWNGKFMLLNRAKLLIIKSNSRVIGKLRGKTTFSISIGFLQSVNITLPPPQFVFSTSPLAFYSIWSNPTFSIPPSPWLFQFCFIFILFVLFLLLQFYFGSGFL